jgi:hypothetical protein
MVVASAMMRHHHYSYRVRWRGIRGLPARFWPPALPCNDKILFLNNAQTNTVKSTMPNCNGNCNVQSEKAVTVNQLRCNCNSNFVMHCTPTIMHHHHHLGTPIFNLFVLSLFFAVLLLPSQQIS